MRVCARRRRPLCVAPAGLPLSLRDYLQGFVIQQCLCQQLLQPRVLTLLLLAAVVKPENRVRVADALAANGRKIGLTDEDFAILESVRDRTPAEPQRFE